MDISSENDRLLYELEQFLIKNDASDYLHHFLRFVYPRITSGEIIIILVPVDVALARLVTRSRKTLNQIINLPEGRDILMNFVSSIPIQQVPPVYTSVNGAYLTTPDKFDQLKPTSDIRLGNLFAATINGIINMSGQLEKLQQVNIDQITILPQISTIIGNDPNTNFDNIPSEVIRKIALNLSMNDIVTSCRTSIRFNAIICDSESFWNEKTRQDFPQQQAIINDSWKNTYRAVSRKLYTFGSGRDGRLGLGSTEDQFIPVLVKELNNITMVACGAAHTVVVSNGQLYTFGSGASGELGHGDRQYKLKPKLIEGLNNVTYAACGEEHTAVISNHKLYTFGDGSASQLGHGNRQTYLEPKLVEGLDNVTMVACGSQHTAVISNGQLYTFGDGNWGQLGHGERRGQDRPKRVEGLTNVSFVACARSHTAIISNNQLYTVGSGGSGKLGHGDTADQLKPKLVGGLDNVTNVACGSLHTAAVSNNRLYTFGYGNEGELGHQTSQSEFRPRLVERLGNVDMVSCGNQYTAAVSNGQLYTFGNGIEGRLGQGRDEEEEDEHGYDEISSYVPVLLEELKGVIFVACGSRHTAVIAN